MAIVVERICKSCGNKTWMSLGRHLSIAGLFLFVACVAAAVDGLVETFAEQPSEYGNRAYSAATSIFGFAGCFLIWKFGGLTYRRFACKNCGKPLRFNKPDRMELDGVTEKLD